MQKISVIRSEEIIYNENLLVLPSAFVKGDPFRFNAITGIYYDGNYQPHAVPATITVQDAGGEKTIGSDLIYIPSYSEANPKATINVSFSYVFLFILEKSPFLFPSVFELIILFLFLD